MRGSIVVDPTRCVACKRCVLGCAIEHSRTGELLQAIQENEAPRSRIALEEVSGCSVPETCRHCPEAWCVKACPTGALARKGAGEPVLFEASLCDGCMKCVAACPFGVIKPVPGKPLVYKCDLCVTRLDRGELPACVEACRTAALTFLRASGTNGERRPEGEGFRWAEPSVLDGRCSRGVRADLAIYLATYRIRQDVCNGCGACRKPCPVKAIAGGKKTVHVIDQDLCVKCGKCHEVCKFDAVAFE